MKKTLIVLFVLFSLILTACASAITAQTPSAADSAPVVEEAGAPSQEAPPQSQNPSDEAPQAETAVQQPASVSQTDASSLSYPIVDTGQSGCYADTTAIDCPQEGEAFYGQDAQYEGNQPAYQDNGDGTVTDLVTGLMWASSPDLNGDGVIDIDDKLNYADALAYADTFDLAGYDDWRLPTIKELYSLMNFNGVTGSIPYIDTDYFDFAFGDEAAGERDIDAQWASSTLYTSTTMNNQETMFGLNLADGRIKGYPTSKLFYVYYVRGDTTYGENDFMDNGDGTISDLATGLTWLQDDSGAFDVGSSGDGSLNWGEALEWCENLDYAGYDDWRLPDAKELQSLVDYSRSPDATNSAAIDPLFNATYLPSGVNNSGEGNYAHYWSSTTHLDGNNPGSRAAYVAFGEARGIMNGQLMDVHGAGAQRSDLKSGDPDQLPQGFGPQGDVQSIYNYARCVRSGTSLDVDTAGTESIAINSDQQTVPEEQSAQNQSPEDGQPPEIDIAAAAETLGVSTSDLEAALGDLSQGPPDLPAAAEQLGVNLHDLEDALGITPPPRP